MYNIPIVYTNSLMGNVSMYLTSSFIACKDDQLQSCGLKLSRLYSPLREQLNNLVGIIRNLIPV